MGCVVVVDSVLCCLAIPHATSHVLWRLCPCVVENRLCVMYCCMLVLCVDCGLLLDTPPVYIEIIVRGSLIVLLYPYWTNDRWASEAHSLTIFRYLPRSGGADSRSWWSDAESRLASTQWVTLIYVVCFNIELYSLKYLFIYVTLEFDIGSILPTCLVLWLVCF